MMKYSAALVVVLGCIGVAAQGQTSPVPPLVNYQGKLTDANADPLDTGEYDLYFRIWDHATATADTNLVWCEKQPAVPVVRGMFNVILGGGAAISGYEAKHDITVAFNGADRYMGIQVEDPGGAPNPANEMSPRQRILTAPYAFIAQGVAPDGVTEESLADGAVTREKQAPVNMVSVSGSATTNSSTPTQVMQATITTTGRPVLVTVSGGHLNSGVREGDVTSVAVMLYRQRDSDPFTA